jgi:two-component system OmpR family response regulator
LVFIAIGCLPASIRYHKPHFNKHIAILFHRLQIIVVALDNAPNERDRLDIADTGLNIGNSQSASQNHPTRHAAYPTEANPREANIPGIATTTRAAASRPPIKTPPPIKAKGTTTTEAWRISPAGDRTMKVLVIEDDAETAAYIVRGLAEHGHLADHAADGRDGLFIAGSGDYDVLVIDRMLPAMDGLAVVRTLRAAGVKAPVLFLTALSGVGDRVQGLEAGGDDYLVKPFAFAELLARLNALARRPPLSETPTVLRIGDLELDLLKRQVTRGGEPIALQSREFLLLEFLIRHAGQVVTRTMLLEGVWDFHFDPKTNIVETHISRLRAKISRGGRDPELIYTIRGAGYIVRTQDA